MQLTFRHPFSVSTLETLKSLMTTPGTIIPVVMEVLRTKHVTPKAFSSVTLTIDELSIPEVLPDSLLLATFILQIWKENGYGLRQD